MKNLVLSVLTGVLLHSAAHALEESNPALAEIVNFRQYSATFATVATETTSVPSLGPTLEPTSMPSILPTAAPTGVPTIAPSPLPTPLPSLAPTSGAPTFVPTRLPTHLPTFADVTCLKPGPAGTSQKDALEAGASGGHGLFQWRSAPLEPHSSATNRLAS